MRKEKVGTCIWCKTPPRRARRWRNWRRPAAPTRRRPTRPKRRRTGGPATVSYAPPKR